MTSSHMSIDDIQSSSMTSPSLLFNISKIPDAPYHGPSPDPRKHPANHHIHYQMPAYRPRRRIEQLRAKHSPDKQVHAQRRAGRHDARRAQRAEQCQARGMRRKSLPSPGRVHRCCTRQQHLDACQGPPDGPGPVANKDEEANGGRGKGRDAVVGAREVDCGYRVCAARGEEGRER